MYTISGYHNVILHVHVDIRL